MEWSYYDVDWSRERMSDIDLTQGYGDEMAKKRMCKSCVAKMKALASGTVKAVVIRSQGV